MSDFVKRIFRITGVIVIINILQYYTGTLNLNIANYIKGLIVGMMVAYSEY